MQCCATVLYYGTAKMWVANVYAVALNVICSDVAGRKATPNAADNVANY
jgi:hypothetical protein